MNPISFRISPSLVGLLVLAAVGVLPGVLPGVPGVGKQGQAHATSFYERPFPDSVKDAPVIVRGKISSSTTDWGRGDDSGKRIYTFWELQIQEVFKGAVNAKAGTLLMRDLGGEKDGVGMQVPGASHFNVGEDVVVFLSERNGEGSYDVWGMMMGKFSLQKDDGGKEYLTGPGINDLTTPRIGDGDGGHDDTPGAKKWSLEALRRLIASQDGPPAADPNPVASPRVTPRFSSPPPGPQSPDPAASLSAPQLQITPSEESNVPEALKWVLGAGLLGWVMVLIVRRRK